MKKTIDDLLHRYSTHGFHTMHTLPQALASRDTWYMQRHIPGFYLGYLDRWYVIKSHSKLPSILKV